MSDPDKDSRVSDPGKDARVGGFAELVAATNYSFLRGASHPSDMVHAAMKLKLTGIGIADRNTVAGVVRAWAALKEAPDKAREWLLKVKQRDDPAAILTPAEHAACATKLRVVSGARLVFADGTPDIVAYPATRHGWGRLTRLLSQGNLRAVKGDCILHLDDLVAHLDDLLLIVLPTSTAEPQQAHRAPVPYPAAPRPPLRLVESHPSDLAAVLARLRRHAPDRVWLGGPLGYGGRDQRELARLAAIARSVQVPLLATNDALYATPDVRQLHDVVTCIRAGTTVAAAGRLLAANAERHLKSAAEMARLYRAFPAALTESERLLARIAFDLGDLRYEYPHEPVPDGWDPQDWLEHLTWEAARKRYGDEIPARMLAMLDEEFRLIRDRDYAYYFLTVHDVVRFARTREPPILCQGRGSAANSAVCFLLGITSVDPLRFDLLFSRFVSAERNEPPDIDVDFEHERREEVLQYIYRRYGRHRAGIAATVIHYRPRSALREVGKALGFSEDMTARLAGMIWGSFPNGMEARRYAEAGVDLANPQVAQLKSLVDAIMEFPRHLSQHVGGYVLTEGRLDELVPVHHGAMKDRSFIEWDKDDIDALKLMKVDVLALGMLTCVRKAFDLMTLHDVGEFDLEVGLSSDDPAVYEMLQRGDSIGVFQVESRAQINMLPRLKPRKFYDLVIQVAIVRPGPIQGDMVHPYLRRRRGDEIPTYPAPDPRHGPPDELKDVLGKTLGVPLFQEQAMKLAIVAAKFSPEDANRLRRAMATFRNIGKMERFQEKMVGGMVARGYERDFAERCYGQIEGFGSYGFPESHALSFARLVYVSSWIKCHHPAVFACAILNSQPMGFYAPAQLVRDAREHGVEVRPIDVAHSDWHNTLERRDDGALALRLGLRQLDGFRALWADQIADARAAGPFADVESLARRASLPGRALRLLADGDALASIAGDRRAALWEVRRTPSDQLPLFAAARAAELGAEADLALPAMPRAEHVVLDYQTHRLSLKDHPLTFLRDRLRGEGVLSCAEVQAAPSGRRARVAGVVLVRQRPGKGNAIFVTLEDESGITNVVIWARLFERMRRPVMAARLMEVEGVVQREGIVVHLMAERVRDRNDLLDNLTAHARGGTDVMKVPRQAQPQSPDPRGYHPRDVRVLPRSRDFH